MVSFFDDFNAVTHLGLGEETLYCFKLINFFLGFKCKEENDKLKVTIVSCADLPDLDGALNKTDAYVIVTLGLKKYKTNNVGSSLAPTFDKDNEFVFNVRF